MTVSTPGKPLTSVDDRLPPKNQLVLCYLVGFKHHSGANWTREGWWLLPWHAGERNYWAAQFLDAACKQYDADEMDVTDWMPLPEAPR